MDMLQELYLDKHKADESAAIFKSVLTKDDGDIRGFLNDMCYINSCFTLLTYQLALHVQQLMSMSEQTSSTSNCYVSPLHNAKVGNTHDALLLVSTQSTAHSQVQVWWICL